MRPKLVPVFLALPKVPLIFSWPRLTWQALLLRLPLRLGTPPDLISLLCCTCAPMLPACSILFSQPLPLCPVNSLLVPHLVPLIGLSPKLWLKRLWPDPRMAAFGRLAPPWTWLGPFSPTLQSYHFSKKHRFQNGRFQTKSFPKRSFRQKRISEIPDPRPFQCHRPSRTKKN